MGHILMISPHIIFKFFHYLLNPIMKIKYLLFGAVSVILLIIVVYFISSISYNLNIIDKIQKQTNSEQNVTSLKNSYILGRNIRSLKTDTIQLNDLLIINFWASWCKPCIEEQPQLEELSKKIKVIQFSFDSLQSLRAKLHESWTIPSYKLLDTSIFTIPAFLPKAYVIKNSTVLKIFYGKTDWSGKSIVNYIDSIIKISANKSFMQVGRT